MIKRCKQCQKHDKLKTQASELKPIRTDKSWDKVGIDLIGKLATSKDGHEYVLSVTCLFSKWVEFYPLHRKTGAEDANSLQQFMLRHGREFNNQINDQLCTSYEIRHMVTSAYHP